MNVLDRLQRFMEAFADTDVYLNAPASREQIAAAEAAMHVRLPAEVRAAYRRFNGITRVEYPPELRQPPRGPALFVNASDWIDLERMVHVWRARGSLHAMQEASGVTPGMPRRKIHPHIKVRPVDWHPKWIPIADSNHWRSAFIDLKPTPDGVRGQIVLAGIGGTRVCATGFNSCLERLFDGLDSGMLMLDRDGGWYTSAGKIVTTLADAGV